MAVVVSPHANLLGVGDKDFLNAGVHLDDQYSHARRALEKVCQRRTLVHARDGVYM